MQLYKYEDGSLALMNEHPGERWSEVPEGEAVKLLRTDGAEGAKTGAYGIANNSALFDAEGSVLTPSAFAMTDKESKFIDTLRAKAVKTRKDRT